jgi:hypothetical protein
VWLVRHPDSMVHSMDSTLADAQDGCADYILVRGPVDIQNAYLHPQALPPDTAWDSASGWASASHGSVDQWDSQLSDHRPLVVDLVLQATSDGERLCHPRTPSAVMDVEPDEATEAAAAAAAVSPQNPPPSSCSHPYPYPAQYAIYLRPVALQGAAVDAASASQKRWGGLHVTLCSFAPKLTGTVKPQARGGASSSQSHAGSVRAALQAMHSAACAVAYHDKRHGSWQLAPTAALERLERVPREADRSQREPLPSDGTAAARPRTGSYYMFGFPPDCPTLGAICAAAAGAGMLNARHPETLHLTMAGEVSQPSRYTLSWPLITVCVFVYGEWHIALTHCR